MTRHVMREHDDDAGRSLPLAELEEQVVFGEWARLRQSSSRSLGRMRQLMDQLGYDPQRCQHRVLGVVGSKGKGTAAAYASAAAASSGSRVVTVMSPGVLSNADRVRVDGQVAAEDLRREGLLEIAAARRLLCEPTEKSGYLAPTGLFLLMGFLIAQRVDAETVIAEAGIGGASDDLSHWPLDGVVVTTIFGEHLDLLGPTVEDVARDKAGVITPHTQWVVACTQEPAVQSIIDQRCSAADARLVTPAADAQPWVDVVVNHVPAGFARENAAVGATAGAAISTWRLPGGDISAAWLARLADAAQSVHYPGRLSVHDVPAGVGGSALPGGVRRCVVDSAVSGAGLRAALACAEDRLGGAQQVLVCLPPSKDMEGFVSELEGFAGRKVFVEMPGAYIGAPGRSEWPSGAGWEWVRLEDLGSDGVHRTAGSEELLNLLSRDDSLAVGTVLFTSLVLRTVGAEAQRLFTAAG